MNTLEALKQKALLNPEVKEEYDRISIEMNAQALINVNKTLSSLNEIVDNGLFNMMNLGDKK